MTAIGTRTSHPDWIVQQFVDELGPDDALATLALDNEPPAVTLRVNPMRATVAEVAAELRALGIEVEPGQLAPDALLVRHTGDLGSLDLLRTGRVSPQDQASQAVVAALDPQPGERILDVASAPGGKAIASAERMRDDGLVVAADLHPARVRTVMRGAALRARVGRADRGRRPAPAPRRRRVRPRVARRTVHRSRRAAAPARRALARRAARRGPAGRCAACIAHRARRAPCVPGGRLVYSVCTLTRIETLGVDAFAASELPDFVALDPPGPPWRRHGRGALLVPSAARTDGMFVLVLERSR